MHDWPPDSRVEGFDGRIFLTETEWKTYRRRQAVRFTDQSLKAAKCGVCGRPTTKKNPLQLAHRIGFYHGVHFLGLTPDYLDGPANLGTAHRKNCNKKMELGFVDSLRSLMAMKVRALPPFLPGAVLEEWSNLMYEEIRIALAGRKLQAPDRNAVAARRWKDILDTYCVSYKWWAFTILAEHMTDDEYCDAVPFVWVRSEGNFDEIQFDAVFINHGRKITTRDFMTNREKTVFDALSEPITVYRGAQASTADGVSWTLNEDVAEEKARRAAGEKEEGEGQVIKGSCAKTYVLAYFNDNSLAEEEVLVKPDHVEGKTVIRTVPVNQPD